MEYEINSKKSVRIGIKELLYYRELFYFFTLRDIKVKYKQTFLGFAWASLQPLIMALIFTVFFSGIIGEKVNLGMPYPMFVLIGMIMWNVFSSGLSNASNSMINNANIIKKIYFPRLIIPMSSILVSVFDFLMAFVILVPFSFYYSTYFQFEALIYIPLALLNTVLVTFGLGSFLAALNIKYRDFRYIVPFLIQSLLFISPVIYPADITDNEVMLWINKFNPMSLSLDLIRSSFSGSFEISINMLFNLISTVLIFVVGLLYFKRTENYFADIV